ncbi:MAG: hypothetical protein K5896_05460 [Prevotella sp.]|nr:hypothetical protein [Prevotella sp.]
MTNIELIIFIIVTLVVLSVTITLPFILARFDTKTPNDGYIKYCFDEAKKCKEQGDEDGEKAWLLEAIKSACYTF